MCRGDTYCVFTPVGITRGRSKCAEETRIVSSHQSVLPEVGRSKYFALFSGYRNFTPGEGKKEEGKRGGSEGGGKQGIKGLERKRRKTRSHRRG